MKALSTKIAVGTIALGVLFYFLACSPSAPNNNNNNQNQALSPNQNQANGASATDLRPCNDFGSGHGEHAKEIKKKIEDKMGPSLKKLLKNQNNPNGTFTVEVKKASSGAYFVAYIKGKVSGDDNLKELSNILNDFQGRQDCLRVVYFLPGQNAASVDGDGFEWSSCEYPMVVCPTGECCLPASANTNTTGNSNTGSNTNANTNTGGNANN